MNLDLLKEKYKQFKRWQRGPVKYVDCDETHYCNNCGLMFVGNYCPRCSQRADMGRISWKSVRNGIMDIWGLGTRSLIFSIWQLLLRPGYFISDYISGKRQVSFPPVKMLFIVTVIFSLVVYWFFPQVLGIQLEERSGQSDVMFKEFYQWSQGHYSWAMLGLSVLAIIPTWVLFRYSPRNTRHSLPEGFFVQVLFSVLMVALDFFLIYLGLIHYAAYNTAITLFAMFYYIVGYMQLFGYGFWGTLWRQAFIFLSIVFMEFSLIFAIFNVDLSAVLNVKGLTPEEVTSERYHVAVAFVIFALFILAVGHAINLIAARKVRNVDPDVGKTE